MPRTPEEPQIFESVPGSPAIAGTDRPPHASGTIPPVPGPRSASGTASPPEGSGPTEPVHSDGATVGSEGSAAPRSAESGAAPQITLVSATEAGAVAAADDSVDELLDEGFAGGDILVLTTGEEHPWAQHERSFGEDAYWRQLAEGGDVFYAHSTHVGVGGHRSRVVLAVNGGTDAEVARALPVALEKASTGLVVCGDQGRLRSLI